MVNRDGFLRYWRVAKKTRRLGIFVCVTSHVIRQRGNLCGISGATSRRTAPPTLSRHFSRAKIGHLVVDVLEPLFYAMLEMVGGDLSSWDTDVILGELLGSLFSSRSATTDAN